jgi:methionyl-tRNA synthetase
VEKAAVKIFNKFTAFKVLVCPECDQKYFTSQKERFVSIGGTLCENCGEHLTPANFEALVGILQESHICVTEDQETTTREIEDTRIKVKLDEEQVECRDCGEILEPTKFYESLEEFRKDAGIELLAEELHNLWMDWSKNIAEEEEISEERIDRWEKECWKPYEELSEKMKHKDRRRARQILENKGVLQ